MNVCREIITKLIELCGEVATLTSPVVCNSSPEGFLPGAQVFATYSTHIYFIKVAQWLFLGY